MRALHTGCDGQGSIEFRGESALFGFVFVDNPAARKSKSPPCRKLRDKGGAPSGVSGRKPIATRLTDLTISRNMSA